MINIIVRQTNKKASAVFEKYNSKNPNNTRVWIPVTDTKMCAFLVTLICAGANNSNTDNIREMRKSTLYPLYRADMGVNRLWNTPEK